MEELMELSEMDVGSILHSDTSENQQITADGVPSENEMNAADAVNVPDRPDFSTDGDNDSKEAVATTPKHNTNNLYIRIDMRYFRISFHKNTIAAIGNPEYIRLAYHMKSKRLVIFVDHENKRRAVHLRADKKGSYYVHSKSLLTRIREISHVLTEDRSYLFDGVLLDRLPGVCISLEKAQELNDETLMPDTEEEM